jgi:hypothetical protein
MTEMEHGPPSTIDRGEGSLRVEPSPLPCRRGRSAFDATPPFALVRAHKPTKIDEVSSAGGEFHGVARRVANATVATTHLSGSTDPKIAGCGGL